ncbi:MAG: hypothetical protein AAB092_06880 [Chloroflexota bacterium]
MGRFLMYATIVLLAVFVLSSFTLLKHGNEGLGLVKTLSANNLATDPRLYEGATIAVDGTLVYNDQLSRYELTDETATTPTPIEGLSDVILSPMVGKRVRVNGKFAVSTGGDRLIEADTIRLLDEPAPSSTPAAS